METYKTLCASYEAYESHAIDLDRKLRNLPSILLEALTNYLIVPSVPASTLSLMFGVETHYIDTYVRDQNNGKWNRVDREDALHENWNERYEFSMEIFIDPSVQPEAIKANPSILYFTIELEEFSTEKVTFALKNADVKIELDFEDVVTHKNASKQLSEFLLRELNARASGSKPRQPFGFFGLN